MTAAQAVKDALNNLLAKVQDGGWDAQQAGQYDAACDDILGATDRLFNSMGNAGEMVKQAKILALVRKLYCSQRSKLIFSKSRLLATFNIIVKWSPKKRLLREGHFMIITPRQKKDVKGGFFMTYYTMG